MTNTPDMEFYVWLQTALFWIGVLLLPLGLALVLIPSRVLAMTGALNRWVSTKPLFDELNRPRYQERVFYRYHHLTGTIIVVASLVCLYMLAVYVEPADLVSRLVRLAGSEFGKWLMISLYYLLLVCLFLALIIGAVVFIRPSLLKSAEAWGNRWVDTEKNLEQLDEVHNIPTNILPGKPRWFGLFVLAGAAYMIYRTVGAIF